MHLHKVEYLYAVPCSNIIQRHELKETGKDVKITRQSYYMNSNEETSLERSFLSETNKDIERNLLADHTSTYEAHKYLHLSLLLFILRTWLCLLKFAGQGVKFKGINTNFSSTAGKPCASAG